MTEKKDRPLRINVDVLRQCMQTLIGKETSVSPKTKKCDPKIKAKIIPVDFWMFS